LKPSKSILVVDDEQAHTLLISELLKKSGYTVSVANDGFKAIAACKVRTPDLIVLDLHMPMMGGVEIIARLRSEDKMKDIPIIFLGTKGKALPSFNFGEQTEEDVLIKPFEPNELLSRVKTALKQKALTDKLKQKEGELSNLSLADPLTSLKSAAFLKEFIKTNTKQSKRYKTPFSLLVFEVDGPDTVLEQRGKEVCEKLVGELANFISTQLRDSDVCALTGKFEVSVVLTMTEKKGAIEVAERIRNKIRQTAFELSGATLFLTVSVGLCQFAEMMDDKGEVIFSYARAALQQAHDSGGDVTLTAE
jgi:diguanylate cyclase (GGDEF)-like protein